MKKRNAHGICLGGATLVMIFSVLCLTIFSVMALVTAKREMKLAIKTASAVSEYYAADREASELLLALKRGDIPQSAVTETDGKLAYSVNIDDGQSLYVVLDKAGFGIESWKVIQTADWQPDERLEVWDGG